MAKEIKAHHWDSMMAKGLISLSSPDYEEVDDWKVAVKVGTRDTKYGRMMYSEKLDRLRGLTMMEFYGNAIVD